MKPTPYNINEKPERERLLFELAGYLAKDKEACRKAFLDDGTDRLGREFALDALDRIRKER